jgi:hypothetical protein
MIAAHVDARRPVASPWQPKAWKGFSMGVIVGGLCAGVTLLRVSASGGGGAPTLDALSAGLTAAEERKVEAVLADGRRTWETAVAYFASTDDGGEGAAAADHRDEIEEVVAGSIRARLVEELGPSRARLAERELGSLVSVVAETSPR